MNYIVVIPARLESTRLPEKPLIKIKGKTVIQRTYEQCLKAVPKDLIYIATDSNKIKEHVETFTNNVLMTSSKCLTGTDRIAEVAKKIEVDYYINVQGDEPIINPSDISIIVDKVKESKASDVIFNGFAKITSEDDYFSLTIPKVTVNNSNELLYMSRSPIPGSKSGKFTRSWKQVCIYGFPKNALDRFSSLGKKTLLESIEDIEILRFLEMGNKVQMVELEGNSIAVDTKDDLRKVEERL